MMIKYLSPLVCKEIAKMLLEKEVVGDILLKRRHNIAKWLHRRHGWLNTAIQD